MYFIVIIESKNYFVKILLSKNSNFLSNWDAIKKELFPNWIKPAYLLGLSVILFIYKLKDFLA